MMSAKEILKLVKAKLENPECWTKDTFARDRKDIPVRVNLGCKWCLAGAINSLLPTYKEKKDIYTLLIKTKPNIKNMNERVSLIPAMNDSPEMTHSILMEWLDRAIEIAI